MLAPPVIETLQDRIVRLHRDGLSHNEICAELDITHNTVVRWLRLSGLTQKTTGHPGTARIDALVPEMRRLRAKGMSYNDIGRRIGVSHTSVMQRLRGAAR